MTEPLIIRLTQGKVALVDACDFDALSAFRWSARRDTRTWYAIRNEHGRTVLMHRAILAPASDVLVDHRDGNGLDCRRHNLRTATAQQDARNQTVIQKHSSRFKGVNWNARGNRWQARIVLVSGKSAISLGYFRDEVEAAKAYDRAALEHFGEFATTNAMILGKEALQ